MPHADRDIVAPRKLVPATAESTSANRPGRIRLSKALAATAKAMAEEAGAAKSAKRVARVCKLARHEDAQLSVLKQRLQGLGVETKKGDLLRAGLMLLASCDDLQLQKAVARLDVANMPSASPPAP